MHSLWIESSGWIFQDWSIYVEGILITVVCDPGRVSTIELRHCNRHVNNPERKQILNGEIFAQYVQLVGFWNTYFNGFIVDEVTVSAASKKSLNVAMKTKLPESSTNYENISNSFPEIHKIKYIQQSQSMPWTKRCILEMYEDFLFNPNVIWNKRQTCSILEAELLFVWTIVKTCK